MATPKVVNGLVLGANGAPRTNAKVTATLSQPCTIAGSSEVVTVDVAATADGTGAYSLSLYANSDLTPAGTYYTIVEDTTAGTAYKYTIVVPGGAGPYAIAGLQTGLLPTASPTPGHVASLVVDGAINVPIGPVTFPAGALPESAVANLVGDLAGKATDAGVVHTTGTEVIAGQKTFSNRVITGADFVHSTRAATEAELVSGLDASLAETVYVALTINRVMGAPINPLAGHRMKVVFTQPAGGNCTVTLPAAVVAPNWSINLGASASTELPIEYNGTTSKWLFALNPPTGTATSPVQGVVTDWGGGFYNITSPSNPSGAADSTGGADSTAAINAAITAAQAVNGMIWVPAGTFLFNGNLSWTNRLIMMGPGTIKVANAVNPNNLLFTTASAASGSIFAFFTLDGNQANQSGGNGNVLNMNGPTDILVLGVTVKNARGYAFRFTGAAPYDARNTWAFCNATGGLSRGFALDSNANKCRIIGCKVYAQGSTGNDAFWANAATETIVAFCQAGPGLATSGTARGITFQTGSHKSIAVGNRVYSYDDAFAVSGSNYCVVADNYVTADSTNDGAGAGIGLNSASYCTVTGNVVTGMPASGGADNTNGAGVDNVGNTWVGNVFQNNGNDGYFLGGTGGDSYHCTFTGNICAGNGRYGINLLSGNADWILIEGNQVFSNTSGNFNNALNSNGFANIYVRNNPGINPPSNLGTIAPTTAVATGSGKTYDCMALISGGTLTAIGLGGCPTPVNRTHTTTTTGGTLAGAASYFYRVTALNGSGETVASAETSIAVPGGTNTNTVTVKWSPVSGATGYNVYGRTTGAELKIASNVQAIYFLDTGSVTPSGALPGADTTGNSATGITAAAAAGSVHSLPLPCGGAIKITFTVAPTVTLVPLN